MATSATSLTLIPVGAHNIETWHDVYARSFMAAGPKSFSLAFFPDGFTPSITAWRIETYLSALASSPSSNGSQLFFLVTDAITSTSLAASRWVLNLDPTPPSTEEQDLNGTLSAIESEYANLPPRSGVNNPAFRALRLAQARAKHIHLHGRPHVYLWLLGTVPEARRRGAARFALEWGLRKARDQGVPVYLESSEEAVGFYLAAGFVMCGPLGFDARMFGLGGRHEFYAMIWEPSSNGVVSDIGVRD